MNQIKTIFAYTFRDAVRKKAFKISTVIMLLLVLVLTLLPKVISALSEEDTEAAFYEGYTIYYIDDQNLIDGGLNALVAILPGITVNSGEQVKFDEYKVEFEEDKNTIIVTVTEKDKLPFITVTAANFMSQISPEIITEALSKTYTVNSLKAMGLDETAVAISQIQLNYNYDFVGNMNISGYSVGILLTMLIFFAIYYYGYGVSMSVATEKTSRVMETLVVSAKPSRILIGKCLAMGAVGLLQFSSIIAFAAICIKAFIPDDFTIMGMPISFSAFTPQSAILIILYFILGYSLYAVLNSVCGASVSKIEDLNSAMMPVMLIALISFYFGYVSAATGAGGTLAKIAMYLPFSSPFIMPFQLLNGNVGVLDVIISIILMVIFIIFFTLISIRIYSASVLNYGKKQKLWILYKTKL
ncbi:MAG: hypothetical protein A2Y15_04105 [Clostridiales bacterium GWF2_36_10]|nr:MAG: hypothetical protein A2Y15_04105 [Clostridiales bacterium GWF2_36_10]HAN20818.1 ABC transporter permease [Clostridiales bacterium]